MSIRFVPLLIAIVSGATVVYGNVPIVVETGAARRSSMNRVHDAGEALRKGDIVTAKRNVDEALQADPKSWPALYMRAQVLAT
jgi:Tfp pilus assembly protein PilF